jgi:hypothetical protein
MICAASTRWITRARWMRSHLLLLLVLGVFGWFSTLPPSPAILRVALPASGAGSGSTTTPPVTEDFPSQPVQEDLTGHRTTATRQRHSAAFRTVLFDSSIDGDFASILRIHSRFSGRVSTSGCGQGPPLFLLNLQLRA